jgi:single-strand DNA-binding protein
MVNRVTLIGNLGMDPEIRTLENGAMVARLRIATDEGYKDNTGNWVDRTEWHDVVAWRGVAERAQRSLKKGMLVYIEGKLQTRSWKDKDTGQDRYKTEVVANYFRIVNSRGIDEDGPSTGPSSSNRGNNGGGTPTPTTTPQGNPESSAEDDLPF